MDSFLFSTLERKQSLTACFVAGLPLVATLGCGTPAPATTPTGAPQMECDSPVSYDGKTIKGEAAVLHIFGGSGEVTDTATRKPNPNVERYFAGLTELCRQYNAGVLDQSAYRDRTDTLTQTLLTDTAPTGAQKVAFAQIYPQLLATPATDQPLELSFSMLATQATSSAATLVHANQPLATGASVWFEIQVNQPAHLYMLQRTARDGVMALFPNRQMVLSNPLEAGKTYRIPPGEDQRFQVDAEDIGVENVYLMVSKSPLPNVDQAVREIEGSAKPPTLAELAPLEPLTQLVPGRAEPNCRTRALVLTSDAKQTPSACTRTRGLVLVGGNDQKAGTGEARASLVVRADPGDSAIVKVFPWRHVTPEDYPAQYSTYTAPTADGEKLRKVLEE